MATFRSESNSVPNTYTYTDRLTALRKKLTTCFKQWRHQLHKHQQHHQPNRQRGSGPFYKIFLQADCTVLGEKVTYLQKFKKIFATAKRSQAELVQLISHEQQQQQQLERELEEEERQQQHQQQQRVEEQQLQIVSTLFSSTLISKYTSSKRSNTNDIMTIMDDTYLGVRDDNPDIDAEIRAILLTHAQNGITISSIKNEYRRLTGNAFPLHNNITDFLLTIPYVTAECCESGKRIFNIKPKEDTRHLHDMILHQRQRESGNNIHNSNNNIQNNNTSQHMASTQEPPRLWRSQYKRRDAQKLNYNLNNNEKPAVVKMAPVQPLATAAVTSFHVYQDNWKHLNNQYQLSQVAAQNNNHNHNNNHPNNIYNNRSDPAQLQLAPVPPITAAAAPSSAAAVGIGAGTGAGTHLHQPHQQHQQLQLHGQHHHHHHHQLVDYTHRRRQEFTPTPTTLSCPSTQHDSMFTINSDYDAYLLDFPLLGDDFFLYLARMELKCRFNKFEMVLQSGLCVSGQTISGARQRLLHVELPEMTQIIVNIGSVDIMRGKPLVQIEHDFRQLIKEMHNLRFVPVLTTLAPLANYRHDKATSDKIIRFNKFIRNEGRHLTVIDIHSCLINESGVVRFDCFQNGPRTVTGTPEPHVFWNKIGRQRVLQMIEQNLEYN